MKIPSCIACDRPLLEKVRQDHVTRPEGIKGGIHPLVAAMSVSSSASAGLGASLEGLSFDMPSSLTHRNPSQLALPGPSSLEGGGSMFSDVIPIGTNSKDRAKPAYFDFSKSLTSTSNNNDGRSEQHGRGGSSSKAYVYKSGFKLPAKHV